MRESRNRIRRTKVLNIIGGILCFLMLPVIVINMTMVAKALMEPDVPPSFMGYTPLIVASGSMSPALETNDIVIVKAPEDPASLADDTIICYLSGDTLIAHRNVGREMAGDSLVYVTQGDANNAADSARVTPSQIIGTYAGRIPYLGRFALFVQTPTGIILVAVLPLLALFVFYHILDQRRCKALLKEKEEQATETAE